MIQWFLFLHCYLVQSQSQKINPCGIRYLPKIQDSNSGIKIKSCPTWQTTFITKDKRIFLNRRGIVRVGALCTNLYQNIRLPAWQSFLYIKPKYLNLINISQMSFLYIVINIKYVSLFMWDFSKPLISNTSLNCSKTYVKHRGFF